MSNGCKVTGHQTLRLIQPRVFSNLGRRRLHTRVKVQSLMANNFAILLSSDPKFSAMKDLGPFETVSKVQETSRILRMGFGMSK